jgi:hypothetical protein
MRRPVRLGVLLLLAGLTLTLPARAVGGNFNLFTLLPDAQVVVLGRLDAEGVLSVDRVLHGRLPDDGPLRVFNGAFCYQRLCEPPDQQTAGEETRVGRDVVGRSVEVVVFLEMECAAGWVPVGGCFGIVGLTEKSLNVTVRVLARIDGLPPQTVYVHEERIIADHRYRRESFLRRVEAEMVRLEERRELASQPPSGGRATRLVSLFLEGVPYEADDPVEWTAAILRPAHADEEAAVGAALREDDDEDDVVALLGLAAAVPLPGLFDEVAARTGREQAAPVRRAAFTALARLDRCRAAGRLAPLLSLDDPLCVDLLQAIAPESANGKPVRLNRDAADALFLLALDLRRRPLSDPTIKGRILNQLVDQRVCDYLHPGMVPFVADWAFDDWHSSAAELLKELIRRTGRSFDRWDRTEWEAWWKEAGPLLGASYDLGTPAGRRAWRQAYSLADPVARELLLRWWLYEPDADEELLLREATGDDSPVAAQAVLAELWARQRLSTTTREAILRRFLTLRLIEEPKQAGERGGWRVLAECAFPLPVGVYLSARATCEDEGEWQLLNFNASDTVDLGEWKRGPAAGRGVGETIELRETTYPSGFNQLWSATWSIDAPQARRSFP